MRRDEPDPREIKNERFGGLENYQDEPPEEAMCDGGDEDDILIAEEIEGVAEIEQQFFDGMIEDMEEQQGQLNQQATVRFALDAMEDRYTIDDVVELSGVPKRTVRRVLEQEIYRQNIEKVADAATGGRFKPVYRTVE